MKIARTEFKEPVPVPGNAQESTTYPKTGKMDFQNGLLTWIIEGAKVSTIVPATNIKFMIPAEEKK